MRSLSFIGGGAIAAALMGMASFANAQTAQEAKDMALLGFHDLQARSAYQPLVREQNGRWILYVGHHGGTEKAPKPVNPLTGAAEFNGTSILDVTDPRAPKYLAHKCLSLTWRLTRRPCRTRAERSMPLS